MREAIEQLTNHQQQLDQDGIMVGVSRQAVDEVLASLAARDAEIARLREAVRRAYNEGFIEGTRENTSRGGNTWMESKARAALEASHDPTSK